MDHEGTMDVCDDNEPSTNFSMTAPLPASILRHDARAELGELDSPAAGPLMTCTKTPKRMLNFEVMPIDYDETSSSPGADAECKGGRVPRAENVDVYLRVKPCQGGNDPTIVLDVGSTDTDSCTITTKAPASSWAAKNRRGPQLSEQDSRYSFTHVLGPGVPQDDVFSRTTEPLVDRLMNGQHTLLLAYGITGSGKTHTVLGSKHSEGILPRALRDIFARLQSEREARDEANNDDTSVAVSYLEIHNENIYDLLVKPEGQGASKDMRKTRKKLRVKEGKGGRVFVDSLSNPTINSAEEGLRYMHKGAKARQLAETQLNAASSRSHCVFSIQLTRNSAGSSKGRTSRLWIVDLAGCEKVKRSGTTGARMNESSAINKSLMHLQHCIKTLRWNQKNPTAAPRVVPYRSTQLTRLFSEALVGASGTGNGKLVMIVTASAEPEDFDETVTTLKYGALARSLVTGPSMPEISTVAGGQTSSNACGSDGSNGTDGGSNVVSSSVQYDYNGRRIVVQAQPSKKRQRVEPNEDSSRTPCMPEPIPARASTQAINAPAQDSTTGTPEDALQQHDVEMLIEERDFFQQSLIEAEAEQDNIRQECAAEMEIALSEVRKECTDEIAKAKAESEEAKQVAKLLREKLDQYSATTELCGSSGEGGLEADVDELHEQVQTCEADMAHVRASHQNELAKLRQENKEVLQEMQAQTDQAVADATNLRAEAEAKLSDAMAEVEQLKKDLQQVHADAQEAHMAAEKLRSQSTAGERTAEKANESIQSMREELKSSRAEADELRLHLEAAREEAREESDALKRELKILKQHSVSSKQDVDCTAGGCSKLHQFVSAVPQANDNSTSLPPTRRSTRSTRAQPKEQKPQKGMVAQLKQKFSGKRKQLPLSPNNATADECTTVQPPRRMTRSMARRSGSQL